jgi:hypothetical protein
MTPPPEPPVVPDDELPPPPSDLPEETKAFPPIKTRKPSPIAGLRRALAIFEKDVKTMAKHGLVSAIILLIFLGIVFYLLSFGMEQAVSLNMGDGGNGDGGKGGPGPLPGSTDHILPSVSATVSPSNNVASGTLVTLDASHSTDNVGIVYYVWDFGLYDNDLSLYGRTVTYAFGPIGQYNITLTVVDSSWNMNQTNISLTVRSANTADTEAPVLFGGMDQNVTAGTNVTLNGSIATDNVAVVSWTWNFKDVIPRTLYGQFPHYTFDNAGDYWIELNVRDAAGNTNSPHSGGVHVQVRPLNDVKNQPHAQGSVTNRVNAGENVTLDASGSSSGNGPVICIWYVQQNNTITVLTGQTTSFTATQQGIYQITLAVRDSDHNVATMEDLMVLSYPAGISANEIAWDATPLGVDMPFNVLTYSYGVALLVSIIYVGGFFAKGFTHEITKGTIKTLFFGPISVTNMVFSKILYPIIIGPLFIFPLMFVSLSRFNRPPTEVLLITIVAYAMAVVTMVAAAYGSCMIYVATKRMSIKPSVMSRIFLYLSLVATTTVFWWAAYILENWTKSTMWKDLNNSYGGITMLSPFHQGGVYLSHALLGTAQLPDLWTFALPAVIIALGIVASRKLYSDIFSRE